jgi:hypothetical protein
MSMLDPGGKVRCAVFDDRRVRRSHLPGEALRLYLEALARQRDLAALVLSDDRGPVAGVADGGIDLGRLAAAGEACARGQDPRLDEWGEEDLYAHGWSLGARTFTLTSLGARVPRVQDVISTVSRIAAHG